MIIIPAIDLIDGQVVRLKQGQYDQKTVYNTDPIEQAKKFAKQGAKFLHIVDLDGARCGVMENLDAILKIRQARDIPIQVGGGLRSEQDVAQLLSAGINRVIVSTIAINQPKLLKQLIDIWGAEKIVVSLDIKNNQPMIKGWQASDESQSLEKILRQLKSIGLEYLIFTDVLKDGMMRALNFGAISEIQKYGFKLIVAGGVSTLSDIKQLAKLGIYGCIIGQALYQRSSCLKIKSFKIQ